MRPGDQRRRTRALIAVVALVALGGIAAVGLGAATGPATGADPGVSTASTMHATALQDSPENVTEEAFDEPAPEEGDPYFEAAADDGRWVSYINPRDEYRNPYLGDGSGKICVTLLNEAGEPIVGETVPNTTVTVPTGESLEWHSEADPFTVDYPLTDNYDRPLDSDQFGTASDVPQGDGILDAHCMELHGLPEDGGTVEYGEAQIEGEHADRIDPVGYIQIQDTWNTSVDPVADAEPYEEAGGGWTYRPGDSHGQVVVVLQLDGSAPPQLEDTDGGDEQSLESDTENGSATTESTANESNDSDAGTDDGTSDTDASETAGTSENTDDSRPGDGLPGFGVLGALGAVLTVVYVRSRRR